MRTHIPAAMALSFLLGGCAVAPAETGAAVDKAALQRQVMDTERAFAKTMADRDHGAFSGFISEQAVFFASTRQLHGKQEVTTAWKKLYESPAAPFSWEPATVEVLDSGDLALSTGPVKDPQGKLIGTFTSIWRQEQPGVWHIVFDKGNDVCN